MVCSPGNQNKLVYGINEINRVEPGDICFVDNKKYLDKTLQSKASFIIMPFDLSDTNGKVTLQSDSPFETYNQIAIDAYKEVSRNYTDAIIDPTADIHPSACIERGVSVGAGSKIGANVVLHEGTVIGDRVKIESGSIIGSDAFYYHKSGDGVFTKWFSCGSVVIQDDVGIGALCTINRGVSSTTHIGEGTKIDCHVHIGHGVVIGKHCLITAQVGISGKTIVGDHVKIFGQAGLTQNLRIGDHAIILAQSGVGDDVPEGQTVFGSPAGPAREKMRELFVLKHMVKANKDKG
jgi:UDP-3-O-[3-hydroxymyristoyl] glucosamine N-acyltransferase